MNSYSLVRVLCCCKFTLFVKLNYKLHEVANPKVTWLVLLLKLLLAVTGAFRLLLLAGN